MNRLIIVFLFAAGWISWQGCYYDNPPEDQFVNIIVENISFNADILPIFEKSCSTSGCHDGQTPPLLTADYAYGSLISGDYINLVYPEESTLYRALANNSMPPAGVISDYEKNLVLGWITKGAFND